MDTAPPLASLLSALWELRCQKQLGLWPAIVQHAAQLAIEEQISRPVAGVFEPGSLIWIDPSGKEIVSAPLADGTEGELTPAQQAEALRIWESQKVWLECVAEGTECPVESQSREMDLSFLKRIESWPIQRWLGVAVDEVVLPEGIEAGETQASDSWKWALGQVLQQVQTSGITRDDVYQYAKRVSTEELKQSSAISAEIARLDDSEFRKQFWAEFKERFQDDLDDVTSLLSAASVEHPGMRVIGNVAPPHDFTDDNEGEDAAATADGPQSLDQRDEQILVAMLELKAVNKNSRKTQTEIARAVVGKSATRDSVKDRCLSLKKRGLLVSKLNRAGGCWLTKKGIKAAKTINSRTVSRPIAH